MTDSTTDVNPGDGVFDAGTSIDDLFGEFEIGDESGDERRTAEDGDATAGEEPDGIEDTTAADVFDQLRADTVDEGGADAVLADESPEDIIASADEPDPEPDTAVDDDLLADEDELEDLLLTGRTKEQEFLWVETEDSTDTDESAEPSDATATSETDTGTKSSDNDTVQNSNTAGTAQRAVTDESTPITDSRTTGRTTSGDGSQRSTDADGTAQPTATDDATPSDADADRGTASIAVTDSQTRTTSSVVTDSDSAERSANAETDTEGETAGATPTTEDEPSGFFGWIRSILGSLF